MLFKAISSLSSYSYIVALNSTGPCLLAYYSSSTNSFYKQFRSVFYFIIRLYPTRLFSRFPPLVPSEKETFTWTIQQTNRLHFLGLLIERAPKRKTHFALKLLEMFGISYGELFLLIGATAALVGPKDLPRIARTAGRLAGRSIGYVQLARGQFDNVMQQSQARQVHKELQDTMSQLDAIRHEIRSLSLMNPGPMTRKLMETPPDLASDSNVTVPAEKCEEEKNKNSVDTVKKEYNLNSLTSTDLHSQATAYARLIESEAIKAGPMRCNVEEENLNHEFGDFPVLPVSAESAGLLPDRKESAKGSDLVLEAVVEAEVARNAKDFFSQPHNQIQ